MTAQLSRERREIIEKTANHIISREATSEHSENLKAVAELALLALAGMDSEPVGEVVLGDYDDCGDYPDAKVVCIAAEGQADWNNFRNGTKLYAAPPAQQPELTVWYGSMPETNGKSNWTAVLHRKGECMSTGITIDRSEYPERVRYEADRMRYLIGELADEPDIMAYDENAHSGYVKPPAPIAKDMDIHAYSYAITEFEYKTRDVAKPYCVQVSKEPPAPVAVPDESAVELLATDLMKLIDKITGERHSVATLSSLRVSIVEACRAAILKPGHVTAKCPKCGDTGLADSGGVQPWGEPISIPCDCTITLAPEQD